MQDVISVTVHHKRTIEDYFEASHELEAELETKNKDNLLNIEQNILPIMLTASLPVRLWPWVVAI